MIKSILAYSDLVTSGWLPNDWLVQINAAIDEHGIETELTGESELSREDSNDHVSYVRVVFGEECKAALPWLWNVYVEKLPRLILEQTSIQVYPAIDTRSAININCIHRQGSDYEKHVDSNPLTGLLFCCDADDKTGGQLIFDHPIHGVEVVNPSVGIFVGFDARKIPHYVSPLNEQIRRTSVPMNYYLSATDQPRPHGIDERLYGS